MFPLGKINLLYRLFTKNIPDIEQDTIPIFEDHIAILAQGNNNEDFF